MVVNIYAKSRRVVTPIQLLRRSCTGLRGYLCSLQSEENSPDGEMLYHWKLAQNFSLVHLNHSLIDFPPMRDSRNIIQSRTVFEKWALFHLTIVNHNSLGERTLLIQAMAPK